MAAGEDGGFRNTKGKGNVQEKGGQHRNGNLRG